MRLRSGPDGAAGAGAGAGGEPARRAAASAGKALPALWVFFVGPRHVFLALSVATLLP